jgi:hypothetical protein
VFANKGFGEADDVDDGEAVHVALKMNWSKRPDCARFPSPWPSPTGRGDSFRCFDLFQVIL